MTIRELIAANPALTDAQIRTLAMNKATVKPIDRQDLADAARVSGAIDRLRGLLATGTAAQKTAAQAVLDLIAFGKDMLRTDQTNPDGTSRNEFAVLANPNGLSLAERTAIVDMAGGMRFATLTIEQVAAERAQMTVEAGRAARVADLAADRAAVNDAFNAYQAAADEWELTGAGERPVFGMGA